VCWQVFRHSYHFKQAGGWNKVYVNLLFPKRDPAPLVDFSYPPLHIWKELNRSLIFNICWISNGWLHLASAHHCNCFALSQNPCMLSARCIIVTLWQVHILHILHIVLWYQHTWAQQHSVQAEWLRKSHQRHPHRGLLYTWCQFNLLCFLSTVIAVPPFLFIKSVCYFKHSLWHCGQRWA
jgi:hypothetical protein